MNLSLVTTLENMKDKQTGFFKIEDRNGDDYWNGFLVDKIGGSRVEINENIFDLTPNLLKVFTDTSGKSIKKLNKNEEITYKKLLKTLEYPNYKPRGGESKSRRYYYNTKKFNQSETDSDLEGQGVKIIIPSSITDIYTRLEILLELKLSGHTDTLTEASNLIDELYKRGEIQNKQQYRNALDKFSK